MNPLATGKCDASVSYPPLPAEFRFASDSLFPAMKDTARAGWVLEKLQPILSKFPRHAPFRQIRFWALAVNGAPAGTLVTLTDSLVGGVYAVGPADPPGDLQRANHCLELANILLARGEALATAESYAEQALNFAESLYAPEMRASCIDALVQIRVAREALRGRDSLLANALAETAALREELARPKLTRTRWDYFRDVVEMLGALATAFAVGWAVWRYLRGKDDTTVARYEANQRAAVSLLGVHMSSFQGLTSEVVGRLFRGTAPVLGQVVDIIYSSTSLEQLPGRKEAIGSRHSDALQWVRFGIGSRAWRKRDTWGQAFQHSVAKVRLDSAVAEQVLLYGGALATQAYRRQLKDRQLATWLIEIAQLLAERRASGTQLSVDDIKTQWSLLLVQRIITHSEEVTYADVFNLFLQIARAAEEGFGSLGQGEKVAKLRAERRTPWPTGGVTPKYLETIVRARIREPGQLARCLARIGQLAKALGTEELPPE